MLFHSTVHPPQMVVLLLLLLLPMPLLVLDESGELYDKWQLGGPVIQGAL